MIKHNLKAKQIDINSTENNNVPIINRIRSKYIIQKIFELFKIKRKYELLKYNKVLKEKIEINIKDNKEFREKFSSIELELSINNIENENLINIIDLNDLKYFHFYVNNEEKETNLEKIYKNKNISKIKIVLDYQITSLECLFYRCEKIRKIKFTKFNRNNIINMQNMFGHCYYLISIDLRTFNTDNVTNMNGMFAYCESLKELDLSSFNTNNVQLMASMFKSCHNLEKINLSSFNTENIIDMSQMFAECSNLKELDLSSFKTENLTTTEKMFIRCYNLKYIKFSQIFQTKKVIAMNEMFYGCNKLKELL